MLSSANQDGNAVLSHWKVCYMVRAHVLCDPGDEVDRPARDTASSCVTVPFAHRNIDASQPSIDWLHSASTSSRPLVRNAPTSKSPLHDNQQPASQDTLPDRCTFHASRSQSGFRASRRCQATITHRCATVIVESTALPFDLH
jgi:hypothetical protein